MECPIINPALSLLMKHLVIGQRHKAPNSVSAFHWSPHGGLDSIGQHFATTRVVHLPKRTETSSIIESDRSEPNHRIGRGCAGRAIAGSFSVFLASKGFNFSVSFIFTAAGTVKYLYLAVT